MDAETLTALRGSIEKWKAIEAGTGADFGYENCPLCQHFTEKDEDGRLMCEKCPVGIAAKEMGCNNTPYEEWAELEIEHIDQAADEGKAKALARKEREFLESLLPISGTVQETPTSEAAIK